MASRKLKKETISFELNINNFLRLIELALLHPTIYAESIPFKQGLKQAVFFFSSSVMLGFLVSGIIRLFSTQHYSLFFLLSELIIVIPFLIIDLFILTAVFFAIAKLLGGKGSFEESLAALAYATIPVIFFAIPMIGFFAFLWMIYILTISFTHIHHYSRIKAFFTILSPILVLILIGIVLGIVGSILFVDIENTINQGSLLI